ncbi:sigma factor [Olivibacter sp. CPCC 100613]|uniref:RNA polymerase sigma factor n=1 Tax=Olivibacter sp. CPCC 100613 TaxID=3079931 RepID=UPI002FF84EDB
MTAPLRDQPHPPIEEMYRIAKQYCRRQEEVDDLVQDLLFEAVKTGRNFSDINFMAWGRGFLRKHAAFIARTEGRRRKREETFHASDQDFDTTYVYQLPEDFIAPLRPSLRILARLVNGGLNRKEILYLLTISDTALRQRLTALRREWKIYGALARKLQDPTTLVHTLPTGLMRQSLLQTFKHTNDHKGMASRIIGSHDPDGHLFIISSFPAHKKNSPGNNDRDKSG